MKKIITKYYFLIIPLFVTLFMLLQGVAFFQVDDRFMLEMATSFKTNNHSEHIMFINIVFGYILKFLYGILPGVNWFAVMYIVVVNIAFIPLYKVTQNYNHKRIFAGLIAVMQISVFLFLTFTFLSFICSTAAIIWGLENVTEISPKKIKHLAFSFLLFIVAFGMRSGSTFLCVLILFLPIYYFAIRKKRNTPTVIFLLIAMTIAANYIMVGFQKEYKKSIPEETYFNQFQKYRAMVSDDLKLNYEDKESFYDSIGISENDIELYKGWKYADKNVFSEENLRKIVETQMVSDRYTLNVFEYQSEAFVVPIIIAYIIMTLIFMVLLKERRNEILVFSLFVLGAILYLYMRRRAPFRIVFPMFVLATTVLMYVVMQELKYISTSKAWYKKVIYVCLCFLVIGFSWDNVSNIMRIRNQDIAVQKVNEYISADNTKTYITDEIVGWDFVPHLVSFDMEENNRKRPQNIFGDWYIYSYFWYDRLDNMGLLEYHDCTFKAVLDENVRMVYGKNTDPLDRICLFLKEHYGIYASYQKEDAVDGTGYYIYKFDRIK